MHNGSFNYFNNREHTVKSTPFKWVNVSQDQVWRSSQESFWPLLLSQSDSQWSAHPYRQWPHTPFNSISTPLLLHFRPPQTRCWACRVQEWPRHSPSPTRRPQARDKGWVAETIVRTGQREAWGTGTHVGGRRGQRGLPGRGDTSLTWALSRFYKVAAEKCIVGN